MPCSLINCWTLTDRRQTETSNLEVYHIGFLLTRIRSSNKIIRSKHERPGGNGRLLEREP